jgi:hypothetical protein
MTIAPIENGESGLSVREKLNAAIALADTAVQSDPTGVTGADAITNIISLTQAEYDAIVSPDATTLYVIVD